MFVDFAFKVKSWNRNVTCDTLKSTRHLNEPFLHSQCTFLIFVQVFQLSPPLEQLFFSANATKTFHIFESVPPLNWLHLGTKRQLFFTNESIPDGQN